MILTFQQKKIGAWNEYEVYRANRKSNKVSYTGYPLKLLVKGNSVRWSSPAEGITIFREMEIVGQKSAEEMKLKYKREL